MYSVVRFRLQGLNKNLPDLIEPKPGELAEIYLEEEFEL